MTTRQIENFGRNISFTPAAFYQPASEDEVLEILNKHRGENIRVIGRGHAWSPAIQTEGVLLDLRLLADVRVEGEGEDCFAVVGAGCQVKRLLKELKRQGGYTLPSVGLITEQAIAGAISTGTHGSGKHSISHYVQAVRIAGYDQETGKAVIRDVSSGDELQAARCSLGNLGVIVSVQMQIRRQYGVEEHFRGHKKLADVIAQEKDYPLQQFFLIPWRWTYLAQHRRETESSKTWLANVYHIYWFLLIDLGMHLLLFVVVKWLRAFALSRFLFRQVIPRFVIRRWKVVDDANTMLVMEHELFRHLETELFVQAEHLEEALGFVEDVLTIAAGRQTEPSSRLRAWLSEDCISELMELVGVYHHHYPICMRRVLPDETLISMASGGEQSWYAISLITYERPTEREGFFKVAKFLTKEMATLFSARPHWGKHCPLSSQSVTGLYPRFDVFRQICGQYDPEGAFQNAWMKELLKKSSA